MSALSTVRQLVLVCIASASLFGQTSSSAAKPTPTEGDYMAHDFHFKSGETLPELRLHYRTLGAPTRDANGRVTAPHGLLNQSEERGTCGPATAGVQSAQWASTAARC